MGTWMYSVFPPEYSEILGENPWNGMEVQWDNNPKHTATME